MSTQEQRKRFEAHFGVLIEQRRAPSAGGYAQREIQMMWAGWKAAEAAAIERCAELIDGMNDSAGDRASYDNREMHEGEVERMNALSDAANAIRALLPKEES